MTYQDEEEGRSTLVHEFFHAWVDAQSNGLTSYFTHPELREIDPGARGAFFPSEYMNKVVGCRYENGAYSYNTPPITGYSPYPESTPCHEDFADSASWYVARACDLRAQSPERYEYFRDEIFNGKEYIPVEGCAKG